MKILSLLLIAIAYLQIGCQTCADGTVVPPGKDQCAIAAAQKRYAGRWRVDPVVLENGNQGFAINCEIESDCVIRSGDYCPS